MAFSGDPTATPDRDRIAKALAIINGAKDKSDLVKEIEQALVS